MKTSADFTRNVLTLTTGTAIAQAIPIVISPILTRLYTPEDYGALALFVAVTSVFGSVANGRYELAIMLPRKNEDAINVFVLGLFINMFVTTMLSIVILVFHDQIVAFMESKNTYFWLYFIPIGVFLIGLSNTLVYINNRIREYKDLAKASIYKSITNAFIQITTGSLKAGPDGLIVGQIFSQTIYSLKLFFNVNKLKNLRGIRITKLVILSKRYRYFPIVNSPTAIIDMLTLQMPYMFLSIAYNPYIIGTYFFSMRVIYTPSHLLASSIGQVFLEEVTRRSRNKEPILYVTQKTFKKLFYLSFPITLLLFILSPHIFPLILGRDWEMVGEMIRFLSIVFFIRFLASTLSVVFSIHEFIKVGSLWQILYFLVSFLFFVFIYSFNIRFHLFLYSYVILEVVLYLFYLYLIFRTVRKHDKSLETQV